MRAPDPITSARLRVAAKAKRAESDAWDDEAHRVLRLRHGPHEAYSMNATLALREARVLESQALASEEWCAICGTTAAEYLTPAPLCGTCATREAEADRAAEEVEF